MTNFYFAIVNCFHKGKSKPKGVLPGSTDGTVIINLN